MSASSGSGGSIRSRMLRWASIAAASVAGVVAATAGGAASTAEPAAAAGVCPPPIESAIFAATGKNTGNNTSAGLICNPMLYNQGRWNSQSELNGYVLDVMNRCGNTTSGRYIVMAMLEVTGQPPQAGVAGYDNVCHQAVYQGWVNATSTGSTTIQWDKYDSGAGADYNVYNAVQGVMQTCNRNLLAHAVVSVTDRYPRTLTATKPTKFPYSEAGLNGQCNPSLYRNGSWSSYADLKQLVIDRAYSNVDCQTSSVNDGLSSTPTQLQQINQAYEDLSYWNPLDYECRVSRYNGGSWGSYEELKNRVYHGLFCNIEWLGQIYAYDLGGSSRRINGSGSGTGECSVTAYFPDPGLITGGYNAVRNRVQEFNGVMVAQDIEIKRDGDVVDNGIEYDAQNVVVGSPTGAPQAANLAGNVYWSTNSPTKVIATGGGNVISTGGGNVISTGGGNVISTGGGNLNSSAGGNLISDKGLG
jgi:hypothetical protein